MNALHLPWQPIATAPHGRVILTNCGTAKYIGRSLYSSSYDGWYLCEPDCDPVSCADNGTDVSEVTPEFWADVSFGTSAATNIEYQIYRSTDSCGEFYSWESVDADEYKKEMKNNKRIIFVLDEEDSQ